MSSILSKPTSSYLTTFLTPSKFRFLGIVNLEFNNIHSTTLRHNKTNCRHITYSKGNCYGIKNEFLCVRAGNSRFNNRAVLSTRNMSSYRDPKTNVKNHRKREDDLPVLSELPRRIWPHPFHYLRGKFFIHGIITPYFDNDFTTDNFMDGATKAVEVVSSALSNGDFETLEPLLEKKCLDDIKRKLSFSTATQREKLKVKAENIYSQCLYQIGIMFDDGEEGKF